MVLSTHTGRYEVKDRKETEMKKHTCIEIMKDYNKYIYIKTINDKFYAMEKINRIGIPTLALESSNDLDTFRLLHEIGHCETFASYQTTAYREFLATQWAIDHSKYYGVDVDDYIKNLWQEYIYSFCIDRLDNKFDYELDWTELKGE